MIAEAGQACWHAVTISPSRIEPVLLVGLDLGRRDALHAVAAFLHHAARTHRNVGVAHQLQALGLIVGEEQEVESPYLVRAVVRAVACAHAAVIDHHVQAFRRVHRCAHRANLLARSVLAVLAGHGLEVRPRRGQVAFKISVDAQPLHIAPDPHLLFAHHGNVVLGITAHDAGIASRATVHVDRHAPRVGLVVFPVGEERSVLVGRCMSIALVRKSRIGLVLVQRGIANNAALADRLVGFERIIPVALPAKKLRPVILVVALRHCHAPLALDLPDRSRRVERRPRVANQISVKSRA